MKCFAGKKGKREKTGGKEKKGMKESKKREHVWIRKMFMLMAAFVLILCNGRQRRMLRRQKPSIWKVSDPVCISISAL